MRCIGQCVGKGHRAPKLSPGTPLSPSLHPHVHQPGSSPNPVLLFFMKFLGRPYYIGLIESLAIGDQFSLHPLPHPQKSGRWDWKFQPSHHAVDSTDGSLHPWVCSKGYLTNITRDTLQLSSQDIPRVVGNLCQYKPQYHSTFCNTLARKVSVSFLTANF